MQLTDLDCQNLQRPCPDSIWESSSPLFPLPESSSISKALGTDCEIRDLDLFGIFIPLERYEPHATTILMNNKEFCRLYKPRFVLIDSFFCSILGEILEYHFVRQHKTFGSSPEVIKSFRTAIERNLGIWMCSLRRQLGEVDRTELRLDGPSVEHVNEDSETDRIKLESYPKQVLYGRHICHCLYILLYGKMDFVDMYRDSEWLSSPDFLKAGDHANSCARVILSSSPSGHLVFAYGFITPYHLRSASLILRIYIVRD